MLASAALALLGALLSLVLSATPASAHASLVEVSPAEGGVVAQQPETVRLRFSEPVQVSAGAVTVTGPDGEPLAGLEPAVDPSDGATMVVPLPGGLAEGTYVVAWRVVSLDGHPVHGDFAFAIGHATAPLTRAGSSSLDGPSLLGGAGRALAAAGALSLVGLSVFPLLVLLPARRRLELAGGRSARAAAQLTHAVSRRLVTPVRVSALVAVVGTAAVLADTAVGGGAGLLTTSLETRAGLLLVLRILAVASTAAVLTWRLGDRPTGRARLVAAAGTGLVTLMTFTLSSHAAAAPEHSGFAMAFDLGHLVAAAAWIGGLLGLALAGLPAAGSVSRRDLAAVADAASALFRSFSVVAQVAMLGVLVTGGYVMLSQVAGLSDLGQTGWGVALSAKLALWLSVLLFAAANAFSFVPSLAGRAAASGRRLATVGRLRSAIRVELAIAGVLVVAAALMSATPQPAQERGVAAQRAATDTVQTSRAKAESRGYVARVRTVRTGSGSTASTVFEVVLTTEDTLASAPSAEARLTGDGIDRAIPLELAAAGTWSSAGLELPAGGYRLTTSFDRHDRRVTIPVDVTVPAAPPAVVRAVTRNRTDELARSQRALVLSLTATGLLTLLGVGLLARRRFRGRTDDPGAGMSPRPVVGDAPGRPRTERTRKAVVGTRN